MSPFIATVLFLAGVTVLFYLNRDRSVKTSKALWLPILWLLIIGSRPVSVWLGMGQAANLTEAAEGSPVDAAVFGTFLAGGLLVLCTRKSRLMACLKANWPCLLYFAYCLLSVVWSDFTGLAFKRWVKSLSDLTMVLVLATEADPEGAIGRLIAVAGFTLMPASVLLSKYFPALGRKYDPDGNPMNIGVSIYKNSLGVIALVIALGSVWYFLIEYSRKRQLRRKRILWARGTLICFCISVLAMAHSATAIFCFVLGILLLLASHLPMIRRRRNAIQVLVVLILLCAGVGNLLGGDSLVVHSLGRKSNLTGRTAIWAAVLPLVPNPVVGAGFESFWLGPRLDLIYDQLGKYQHINEAHNGYIEVYLNLGWIGVCLIGIILISGYRGSVALFRRNPPLGGLMLAYVAASASFSIAEAGFRLLGPMWMFLLLAVVGSHGMVVKMNGLSHPAPSRSRFAGAPLDGNRPLRTNESRSLKVSL